MRQPAVPRELAVLNRFLPLLPRDPLILLADRAVMRKKEEKLTDMRRSMGALSGLDIDDIAHGVRSNDSRRKYEDEKLGV